MEKNNRLDFLIIVLFSLAISCLPFNYVTKNPIVIVSLQIACQIFLLGFKYWFLRKKSKLVYKQGKFDLISTLLVVPTLLVCFSNLFFKLFIKSPISVDMNTYNILYIVLTVFVAINEEIVFRLLLINNLNFKKPIYVILLSAGVFAVCHLTSFFSGYNPADLLVVVYTFFLGLLLAFVYLSTKSIYPCIIIHLSFNLFNQILFGYFEVSWRYILISGAFVVGVGLYTLALYFWKRKTLLIDENIIEYEEH